MKDAGRQCYHCKEWVPEGAPHDCWTTTEAALTRDLAEDLQEAWERLRETASAFGEQRIYASHKSIMFSRKACYFFVRPKKSALEVCVFLGRPLRHPRIRRSDRTSASKVAHILHITHRDEVEAPITDWLREAYDHSALPPVRAPRKTVAKKMSARKRTVAKGGAKKGSASSRHPKKAAKRTPRE